MITEERFLEIAQEVMTDATPLTMQMSVADAWMCVSTLQLATRHPYISRVQRDFFMKVARKFEAVIVQHHPAAKPLIDMGWDERFDVDVNDGIDTNAPDGDDNDD